MKFKTEGKAAFIVFDEAIVKIDAEDLPRVKAFDWYLGSKGYVKAILGFGNERWDISLHQLIMSFPEGEMIDHKNRNPLDNRKENLRIASKALNRANSKKNRGAKAKFRGVYPRKDCPGKFRAAITIGRKVINLGTFTSEVSAAKAYDLEALKAFGEYATLNFPIVC